MGWLVGLPLGIFRLLLGLVMLVIRLAVPIAILVVIVILVRRARRAQTPRQEEARKEPHFDGPVYTADYREVEEEDG